MGHPSRRAHMASRSANEKKYAAAKVAAQSAHAKAKTSLAFDEWLNQPDETQQPQLLDTFKVASAHYVIAVSDTPAPQLGCALPADVYLISLSRYTNDGEARCARARPPLTIKQGDGMGLDGHFATARTIAWTY
eukprot:PhM_4_TR6463/c0_g1_i1/m.3585